MTVIIRSYFKNAADQIVISLFAKLSFVYWKGVCAFTNLGIYFDFSPKNETSGCMFVHSSRRNSRMLQLIHDASFQLRIQMTNFIKEVRASKNGSLTGLSFDDIVACVTKLVKERERQVSRQGQWRLEDLVLITT
jgi:hypothetical protein